jgi:hypothetical protein
MRWRQQASAKRELPFLELRVDIAVSKLVRTKTTAEANRKLATNVNKNRWALPVISRIS